MREVEKLLEDVHRLLAIPPPVDAGGYLHRPIALTLAASVDGFSNQLYCAGQKIGGSRERFVACLLQFYPWDIDKPEAETPESTAKIIYDSFRNPLIHQLNLHLHGPRSRKLGRVHRGVSEIEKAIEDLEKSRVKPYSKPFLVATSEKRVLWLDAFYWGVRQMVQRWATDGEQVRMAAVYWKRRLDRYFAIPSGKAAE